MTKLTLLFSNHAEYHSKLEKKLDELVKMDIIEKVDGPSQWISPVVVIRTNNGDVRLCIDMRCANKAVQRERYTIPTIKEILQDSNNSKMFSKLDIKWAYHQIELMFGVNCAPEMNNKLIYQKLEECEGAHSIFDDIVIHGASVLEHNGRFEKVLTRLREK